MSLSHVTEGDVPSILDTYELWINEIVKKLGWENRLAQWEQRRDDTPSNLLWHYTSLDTLKKIIGCPKTVHASLLSKMNDYQEGRWLLSRVIENPAVRDRVSATVANEFGLNFRGELVDHSPLLYTFVFSLSSESDLLSQWRAYASGGRGVAIGFDVATMSKIVGCWRDWLKQENKTVLAPVEYRPEQQKLVIDFLSQKLMERDEAFQRHIRDHDPRGSGAGRDWPAMQTHSWLRETLRTFEPHFKNPAFREEHEWRLIYYRRAEQPFVHGSTPTVLLQQGYRAKEDDLIPYVEFPLATCIKSVILGPVCKADNKTVRDMLDASGIGCDAILRSKATLR